MRPVGFTTGSLFKIGIDIEYAIKLYSSQGANAIELGFSTPQELLSYNPNKDQIKNLNKFEYVSIHAPWKQIEYGRFQANKTFDIIDKLSDLSKLINIQGIVLHPNTIENLDLFEDSSLPFLLENMDTRKDFGTRPKDFEEIKENYDFNFVLDVHHTYEHDPTMQLAGEFLGFFGNRLKELHVSGTDSNKYHNPVHLSENQKEIDAIISCSPKVPIILEGVISKNLEKTISKELEYVRNLI